MSILRELFVRLGLDVDAQSFAKGNLAAEGVKIGLEKVVEVARELTATFIENIASSAEYGEKMLSLGASTGIGTKSLQQLSRAAAEDGIGIDEFAHSIQLLSRQMYGVTKGSEEAKTAFSTIGVRATDAAGKLRPAEDVFVDIAGKFQGMEDGAKKTAIAMQLFGRSGAGMIEFLNRGKDELSEFFDQSVMSEDQLRAGKEVIQVQRALTESTTRLWRDAVGPLLPAIRDLLKQFLEWRKANAEIMRQNLTKFIGIGVDAIKALGKAFIGFVGVLKFFRDNWNGVMAVILSGLAAWTLANTGLVESFLAVQLEAVAAAIAAGAAWLVAAAPFIAIAGIVAGLLLLFDDLRVYASGGRSVFGDFVDGLDKFDRQLRAEGKEKPWWLEALETAVAVTKDLIKTWQEFRRVSEANAALPPGQRQSPAETAVRFAGRQILNDTVGQTPGYRQAAEYTRLNPRAPDPETTIQFGDYFNRALKWIAPNFGSSPGFLQAQALAPSVPGGRSGGGGVVANINQNFAFSPGVTPADVKREVAAGVREGIQQAAEDMGADAGYSQP
jgi:hypothetical protein